MAARAELVRAFNGVEIRQRSTDGYINATSMCQANGKKWFDYRRLDSTNEFIQALAESTGFPAESLVEMRSGRGGGTYVHPDIAIHLAQWCSAKFAVQVSKWVRELLTTGTVSIPVAPRHQRYKKLGKDDAWIETRVEGVAARRAFTDALQEHGVKGVGYPACTNALYEPVLGGPAKEVRKDRKMPPNAELRDCLDKDELAEVMLAEVFSARLLDAQDADGNDECKAVCRRVGETVASVRKKLDIAKATPALTDK